VTHIVTEIERMKCPSGSRAAPLRSVVPTRTATREFDTAAKANLPTRATAGTSQLTVANTGPVIPPGEVGRLFQPFQRLSDRTSHDGFGLGLSIVASIAAVHGGSATARPRDDGGLSVTVTIPPAGAQAQGTGLQAPPGSRTVV
jgi:signal transduction histidine kinase